MKTETTTQSKNRFCSSCGTPLTEGVLFCSHCGKKIETQAPAPLVGEAPAAESLDVGQAVENIVQPIATPAVKKPKKKPQVKKIAKIVRASILVALSLLMCIFAFLPIFTYEIDLEDLLGSFGGNASIDEDLEWKVTPIDTIVFLTDSFHSETEEELEDSELYEDMEETEEALTEWISDYNEDDGIDREGHRLFRKLTYYSFRLILRSEESAFSVDLLVCAILSLIYVLLGIALFVFSVLRLLGTVLPVRLGFEKTLRRLLCAVMPVVLLHRVVLNVLFDDYVMENYVQTGSGFAYAVLALSLVGVLILMLEKLIFEGKRPKLSHVIKASVSFVLIIIAVCVSFAPIFTGAVNVEFSNKTKKTELKKGLPLGYLSTLNIVSEIDGEESEDLEYYETWFDSGKTAMKEELSEQLSEFEDYTTGSFKRGEANEHHVSFLTKLAMSGGSPAAIRAFSFVTLLYYLAIAALGVLLWRDLLFFATLDGAKHTALLEKIFAGIFSVAGLVLVIVFICIVQNRISYFRLGSMYGFGIGAGAVSFVVFSILAVACPTARAKKAKTLPPEPADPAENLGSAEVAI